MTISIQSPFQYYNPLLQFTSCFGNLQSSNSVTLRYNTGP